MLTLAYVYIGGALYFLGFAMARSPYVFEWIVASTLWPLTGPYIAGKELSAVYDKVYRWRFPDKFPFRPRLWGWAGYSAKDRAQMVVGAHLEQWEESYVTVAGCRVYARSSRYLPLPGLKVDFGWVSRWDPMGVVEGAVALALANDLPVADNLRVEYECARLGSLTAARCYLAEKGIPTRAAYVPYAQTKRVVVDRKGGTVDGGWGEIKA